MPPLVTELTFLQHLAKRFDIPVPEYLTMNVSNSEIREALNKWGSKAIIKPDVLTGKRGKFGTIRQVSDCLEAQRELKQVQSLEVNGQLPRAAYLVQYIPSEMEIYTAITYDSRFFGPCVTISMSGGVDIEQVDEDKKITFPVDIYKGLGAYHACENLNRVGCPPKIASLMSRCMVSMWDMFIATGMRMCEINPWRITPGGKPYACDFKAIFDNSNFKFKNLGFNLPEYPSNTSLFEQEMTAWNASSYQGQAHVSMLNGDLVLPLLFGGGASTIITETLIQNGGNPLFLSDFGGNPPYERMYGTARLCFEHNLKNASLLLILGGKANNTLIDVTFKAIADALQNYVEKHGSINIPVVIGRGGPRLVQGLITIKDTMDTLGLPYVIFGPDTPVTQVAEYAAKLAKTWRKNRDKINEESQ